MNDSIYKKLLQKANQTAVTESKVNSRLRIEVRGKDWVRERLQRSVINLWEAMDDYCLDCGDGDCGGAYVKMYQIAQFKYV